MKLHCVPASPSARKVIAVAAALRVPLEVVHLDVQAGALQSPEYLALNPNGKFPTLVDGDFVLWESNAIMQYIASKNPSGLWPSDQRAQIDVLRWQFWESAHWSPHCSVMIWENWAKAKFFNMGAADPVRIALAEEQFHKAALVLDKHLEKNQWLANDDLTLADLSVGVFLDYAKIANYPALDGYHNLQRWFTLLSAQPAWLASEMPMD
ncbi:MAG: glutathione S-transferase family protein [Glaciimonas sp.]|nr:glutathione S-transferase family protein [Glaciimonas sp.]